MLCAKNSCQSLEMGFVSSLYETVTTELQMHTAVITRNFLVPQCYVANFSESTNVMQGSFLGLPHLESLIMLNGI